MPCLVMKFKLRQIGRCGRMLIKVVLGTLLLAAVCAGFEMLINKIVERV